MPRQANIVSFDTARRVASDRRARQTPPVRAHAGRFADDPDFEVRVTGRDASAGRSSARSFAAPASGSRYAPLSMSDAHRGPGSLESRGAARAADVDDEELEAPLGPLGRLTSRFGKKRRQRAKERAGRAYYRQYEAGKPSDASQAGPRAAVYKGEMGSSHRRSSRMQQKGSGVSGRVKMPEAKAPFFTRAPFIVTCATVLCLGPVSYTHLTLPTNSRV
mgnify:FL=1